MGEGLSGSPSSESGSRARRDDDTPERQKGCGVTGAAGGGGGGGGHHTGKNQIGNGISDFVWQNLPSITD